MTDEIENKVNPEAEADASYLSFLPGQRLKKARELRGLTVAQVARDLRLSERYIEAMESDDYKALPEPAFVRGYMRRYAQHVKLSPDDIAAKFDECYAADNSTPAVDERPRNPIQVLGSLARPRFALGKLLSFVSLALVIALLVGALLWKSFSAQSSAPEASPEPVPQEPAAQATPAVVPEAVPAAPAQPATTLPAPASPTVLPTPAAPAAAATTLPAPAPVAVPAAVSATDSLALNFTGDCWISVRDASGRELASGVKKAGQSLSLSGKAPFTLSVGNANKAAVTFNGKAVDLKPYMQGEVANFTLAR